MKTKQEEISMSLYDVATLMNLQVFGNSAHGTINDFHFSLVQEPGKWGALHANAVFVLQEPLPASAVPALELAVKPYSKTVVVDRKIVRLELGLSPSALSPKSTSVPAIDRLSRSLRDLGMTQKDSCFLCDDAGMDKFVLLRGLSTPVHQACYGKYVEQRKAESVSIESTRKNVVKGYLSALVGGLLGAAVNLVIMNLFSYILMWLFALIPLLAMIFYDKAKGPGQKKVPYILGTMSLAIALLLMVFWYDWIAKTWGMTLPEFLAIEDIQGLVPLESFLTDLVSVFFYSLIGIGVVWGYMKKKTTEGRQIEIRDMEAQL